MQSLLKAMHRDLQGLWIARLARDPLLVSGLLLPVWCVGARTRFLMTHCTIPTFVNVFAGNLFIRLVYICQDGGGVGFLGFTIDILYRDWNHLLLCTSRYCDYACLTYKICI